ncbi:MAG: hypothetical protein WCO45_01485 [Pseudanabaena sp. ELA607]
MQVIKIIKSKMIKLILPRKILAFLMSLMLILAGLTNTLPVMAEYGNPYAKPTLEHDLSLDRIITTPMHLNDFDLNVTPQTLNKLNKRQELLKLSKHLRDVARYLGTGWPVNIGLNKITEHKADNNNYLITDIKRNNGEWVTISAGYALNLVTQQLEFIDHHNMPVPTTDFLVKQDEETVYHPLFNLPVSVYLAHLLENQSSKSASK